MKSQDVVILFKLISLDLQAREVRIKERGQETIDPGQPQHWKGWDDSIDDDPASLNSDSYSVRALSASLALSKSEVSNALNRCRDIGLIHTDRASGQPVVRCDALLDFVKYGIRYVFPAKPGPIVRGIATAFAAPVLAGKVMSGGDLIPVWPDAYGKSKGQEVTPLYKTVPGAVKKDELLYHFLALVDAIRIGGPREAKVADAMLREWIL